MYEKTAIITGSTRGIGLSIAKQLGEDGFCIVMVGTQPKENYPEAIQWFEEKSIPLCYVQADISDKNDRQRIVDAALTTFGKIDVLVNNAGVAPKVRKDLLDMEEESFDRLISINTKAPLFLTQLVAKSMMAQPKETRNGKIVFITSCSSVISSTSRGEYCISKAAETMVATLFADRLAAENIIVNEVRPGVIRTDMTSKVKEKYDTLFETGQFPIPRWGEPEDVAGVVSLLCSDKVSYTTGNYIDVDGGYHIPRL
jgi:NAD(P)-dependent dehydrogenase (short-subunit alcohol dehydrogenase family)